MLIRTSITVANACIHNRFRRSTRAVHVTAAAAQNNSQKPQKRFIAFTSLDTPDLLKHLMVLGDAGTSGTGALADSSQSMSSARDSAGALTQQGSQTPRRRRRAVVPGFRKGSQGLEIQKHQSTGPVLLNNTPIPTPGSGSRSFLSLEGSQKDMDKLVSSGAIDTLIEDLPLRLVEPVEKNSSSDSSTFELPYEEAEAHATWGVTAVNALATGLTGEGVKVAVLDTGLDTDYLQHPAFQGINVHAKNFTTDDETATHDVRGHGTHCLGTIVGRVVNGVRIGVAPGVTDVIIGKVISDDGKGTVDMLYRGLHWAWYEQHANIISISLAYDLPAKVAKLRKEGIDETQALEQVQKIYRKHTEFYRHVFGQLAVPGVLPGSPPLVIAACGNGSTANVKVHVSLPASGQGVFSAAAGGVASGVLLRRESGTSMAAPHVAGVAALWWQHLRGTYMANTADEVLRRLRRSCLDDGFAPGVEPEELRNQIGEGLVQAPPVSALPAAEHV